MAETAAVPEPGAQAEDDGDNDAGEDYVDELPEELQPALAGEGYVFPNNSRRRVPAVLYLAVAGGLVAIWAAGKGSTLVNQGFLGAAALLAIFAVYALVSGRHLAVDERDALVNAAADVGCVVGFASAQLGWRGLWSRPTWRVLLYSAEDVPKTRALVFVDGIDGRIVERIVEDNPEDWSDPVSRK